MAVTDLVPSHLKRLFRLKTYFRPYPHFTLVVSDHDTRVRVTPLGGAKQEKKRYLVYVPQRLLTSEAPESTEQQVLKDVLAFAKRLAPAEPVEQLEFLFKKPHPAAVPEAEAVGPCLRSMWLRLRAGYFPDRADLDDYRVQWSGRRHTTCLASCSIDSRRVLVAAAMRLPRSLPFLEALIYHEMCHAVLGRPKRVNGRRVIHGPEFKELERRHPGVAQLDIWIKAGGWHDAVRIERKQRRQKQLQAAAGRLQQSY